MADFHHWIRCCACGNKNKGTTRLISYSGGDWGRWGDGIAQFIDDHMECHGDNAFLYNPDYKFFELVTPRMAADEGWWPCE